MGVVIMEEVTMDTIMVAIIDIIMVVTMVAALILTATQPVLC
jgi:hypothetical protein